MPAICNKKGDFTMQPENKTNFKRILALICAMALLVTSVFYSGASIEAEEGKIKSAARAEYTEIVTQYNSAVETFEKNSDANMYVSAQSLYTKLDESLKEMTTNLQAQTESLDYTTISNLYSTTTIKTSVTSYIEELEEMKTTLPNNDNDNKIVITTLIKEANSLYTSITNVITALKKYTEKYANNKTYSDGVEILIDYYGGKYNSKSSITLTRAPGDEFGIITPTRTDCVLAGWEVISGDTKVELKNGSYTVTVGSQTTVIRAIWKTADGQDAPVPSLTAAPTATPTTAPTATPAPKQLDVIVSFEGGAYNGQGTMTQKVVSNNTIVLFENVDLIRKDGYKVAGFTCSYGGTCKILEDKRVIYSAPSYNSTKIDLISVVWEKYDETAASASPATQNTVYVNLDGGSFVATGKQEIVFYVDINTTKTLFTISDIEKEGYTLKGFKITDGVKYLIQEEYIILLSTDYKASGITLTAIWEEDNAITPEPTIQPTNTVSIPTTIPTPVSTSTSTAQPTNNPNVPTIIPTPDTTTAPTIEPTIIPTTEPTTSPGPVKITLKSNTIYMGVSEKIAIKATATQKTPITYESKNNLICSVTSNGILFGHKVGQTQIVVSAGKTTQKITVNVLRKPSKIGLTNKMKKKVTYIIKKGKTKQLKVYFYKNSYSNKITFSSSNKKIAIVASTGKIKAIKKGTCKITVKSYNGKKAIATIKVK